MSLQATKVLRYLGSTCVVHNCHPVTAKAEQRSWEVDLNELQSLRQAWASNPDRTADPFVFSAAFRIASAFKPSNMIELAGVGASDNRKSGREGLLEGCFSIRISQSCMLILFTIRVRNEIF